MEQQLIKFCRCCLSQADQHELKNMQEINFKNDSHSGGETKFMSIYDGYLICSGMSFDEFSLTKNVCQICAEKLKSFYIFNVQCRKSNDILRENYGVLPEIKEEKLEEDQENYLIYNNDVSEMNNFAQVYVNDNLTAKILPVRANPPEQLSSDEMVDDDRFSDNGDVSDDKAGVVDEEDAPPKKKPKVASEIKAEPIKTEKKSKKSKSSKSSLEPSEINDPSIDNLTPYDVDDFVKNWEKGQYICFFCDEFSASYIQYVEHRKKTHTFDAGMVKVERICNLCSVQTSGYVSHLTAQHPLYKPNICNICQKQFKHQLELRSHLYFHIDLDYKCMACNFTSKNQKALRSHISTTQHSSNYHCPYCGMGFPTFNAVLEHTKDLHNKDSLFPCIKCKGVSLTKNDYDMHKCGEELTSQYEIDEMKENNEFKCEVCTSNFKVKEHYEIHLLTICDGKEKYFCEICVKLFKTRKQLYHHNRLHVERNYQCDECGFCTTIQSMLAKHKIMHRDDRPHKCLKCSSAFKRKSELVRHQETHNEQMYECFICDKKFRSSLGIKTHMSSHVPELKKHPCAVCGKKFSTGHDRNRHAKIHSDAPVKKKVTLKEHPCSICGKVFFNSHDKNKHIKIHAGRPIKCDLCPADFHSSNCLNSHLKEQHGAESCYECKFCGKVLADAIKMKKHMYIHDEFRKPYQCPECSYDFVKRDRFRNHLLRCHNMQYDDAVHGYKEVPNMNEIVTECLKVQYPGTGPINNTLENFSNIISLGIQ